MTAKQRARLIGGCECCGEGQGVAWYPAHSLMLCWTCAEILDDDHAARTTGDYEYSEREVGRDGN